MLAGLPGTDPIFLSRHKAISVLLPHAVCLAQDGQQGMVETILHIASKSPSHGFLWRHVTFSIAPLFDESTPPSLNKAIVLASPYANWARGSYTPKAVSRWAEAVLAIPYSETVGQSVVYALFEIAYGNSLLPHVPIEIWAWLKRRPSLPPARRLGAIPQLLRYIRGLGDIDILKSYFLLVWSERSFLHSWDLEWTIDAIRGEFCGIAMWRHRNDLTKWLDHVLERFEVESLWQHDPRVPFSDITDTRGRYRELKEALAEEDMKAMITLSGTPPNFIDFNGNINDCV